MRMICTLLLLAVLPVARAADCPANLRWQDATFAERTTIQQGGRAHAVVQRFVEGTAMGLDLQGAKTGLLTLTRFEDVGTISFLIAPEIEKPSHFAQIGMTVDVPFGTDPNMAGPCALEDQVTVQVRDLAGRLAYKSEMEKAAALDGWMRRNGMSVEYSVQEPAGVEVQGSWLFSRQPPNLPLNSDMQGWRVFRGDTLLMTLPTGKPFLLSAVLEQLRGAKQE